MQALYAIFAIVCLIMFGQDVLLFETTELAWLALGLNGITMFLLEMHRDKIKEILQQRDMLLDADKLNAKMTMWVAEQAGVDIDSHIKQLLKKKIDSIVKEAEQNT